MANHATVGPSLPSLLTSSSSARSSSTRSSSSFSRLSRRIRSLRVSTQSSSDTNIDVHLGRGAFGLNLLHHPAEPWVDLIFVHGLGGSSIKTWCNSGDPASFWPKEWLPLEPGFKHVRIHSYGYNVNWSDKKQGVLGIGDFGQALLDDMVHSPHLQKHGDTPIIIVAHSMGGLVAKKAYLIATRDPSYKEFSARFHSMYFLATPHRGAGSSQFLKKYLSAVAWQTSKTYVDELHPGSPTLQTLNDEFRYEASRLKLWSFFETQPTKIGLSSLLIVEKDSAVIGIPNEHGRYLDGDHRHICKFNSPEDPNYLILHRCLNTTLQEIEQDYILQRKEVIKSEMKVIANFLGVNEGPEPDLFATAEKQLPGTCSWLTNDAQFSAWLDKYSYLGNESPIRAHNDLVPRFSWLHGPPGSGKSVTCAHVIQYLESSNVDCSFYFLKHSNKEKSSVDRIIRSVAFQMARNSFDVRKTLISLATGEDMINLKEYHAIWNGILVNQIFKLKLDSHFTLNPYP